MKKTKDKAVKQNTTISHSSNEIPTLSLRKVSGTSGFTTTETYLESKGWTFKEAKEGLSILIQKAKEL